MASAMEQAPPEPRLGVSGMNLASASVGRSRDDMIAAMGARMDHVNIGYGHSEGRVIVPDACRRESSCQVVVVKDGNAYDLNNHWAWLPFMKDSQPNQLVVSVIFFF
jgi:hypothetical protein